MSSITYSEQSKSNKLTISLIELGIDEDSTYVFERTDSLDKLFCDLTIYTPSSQSHYGKKFSSYHISSNKKDKFLKSVFNGMGVKNVYLYKTFSDRTRNKNDLHNSVVNDTETMICLRCDNGVLESLYMAVRNAVAHGNIIHKDGFFILYSVNDDKTEYRSNVTFLLKITKLTNLKALIKTLNNYS